MQISKALVSADQICIGERWARAKFRAYFCAQLFFRHFFGFKSDFWRLRNNTQQGLSAVEKLFYSRYSSSLKAFQNIKMIVRKIVHSAHIQQIISQILMISRQKGFLIIETERSLKSLESLARLIEVRWFL